MCKGILHVFYIPCNIGCENFSHFHKYKMIFSFILLKGGGVLIKYPVTFISNVNDVNRLHSVACK